MNYDAIADHIGQWLRKYAVESKSKGFVIGISGGIDSALTSTLCARTGMEVLVIEMPIYQAKNQVQRAKEHIVWLKKNFSNVKEHEVELTPVFDGFLAVLPEGDSPQKRDLALANLRARMRMITLYHFAAINNLLVAGTGNKIEDFGVGFYTKYGDGGVDLSPIADLTKTEVYKLSENLGIIKTILDAAPTDGLWGDDRTDEDQIGASYPELEWAMQFVEDGKSKMENELKKLNKRQEEVLKIYLQRNQANQHKMLPIPVCVIPDSMR